MKTQANHLGRAPLPALQEQRRALRTEVAALREEVRAIRGLLEGGASAAATDPEATP
jgi:hypothetical protein